MNQPTFTEGPPVPMMVEGLLDEALLSQYLDELQAHAQIETTREKNAPLETSSTSASTLEALRQRLTSGQTRAAQIRYKFGAEDWTDTLFAGPCGYKLVRCRHEST